MITVIVLFVLVALAVAFALALGVGPFAIVPAVLAVVVVMWLFAGAANGHRPGDVARRRRRKPDLLGPGGPDDPDQGA